MRADSETLTENVTSKANWPLALCAGLLGIGQNGLLVMLPQLVTLTGLSLSVWAGLLMFGSMLFLPASPWWGRQSERRGCKAVMVASLSGYLASFGVMALVVWAMAAGRLEITGRNKLGAVIGDHVRLGANTVVLPGRVVPPGAWTMPGETFTGT